MVELLNIDCMEYMAGLPDKAFDLAIVDPPYGIGVTDWDIKKPSRPNHTKMINAGYVKYKDKCWDIKVPEKVFWSELIRVSKNQIVWGGNYFTDNLYPSKGWIFWNKLFDKTDGHPSINS